MWKTGEINRSKIKPDVAAGLYLLATVGGDPAGTFRFELEDPLFWPDVLTGEAAYIHRLAIRRAFAGKGLSTSLLQRAVQNTVSNGRKYRRLDTGSDRLKVRMVYEDFGFNLHSYRTVGPYNVARCQLRVRQQPVENLNSAKVFP